MTFSSPQCQYMDNSNTYFAHCITKVFFHVHSLPLEFKSTILLTEGSFANKLAILS